MLYCTVATEIGNTYGPYQFRDELLLDVEALVGKNRL